MLNTVEVQCWHKNMWLLFCVHIRSIGFVKDSGMHARIHNCLQKKQRRDRPITIYPYEPLYEPHLP